MIAGMTHLVSGATGFVGGALVLELLRRTDDPITDAWHAAASLRYEDADRSEILRTNVDGTAGMLGLARLLGVERFHHISTAYVADTRTGNVPERFPGADTTPNNAYEESKIAAERLVQDMARSFDQLASPIQLVGDPDGTLNFIPVDHVVRQAVDLAIERSPRQVVHLTNATPPSTDKVMATLFDSVGLDPPAFVATSAELNAVSRAFDRHLDFYRSYFTGHKEFEQATSEPFAFDFSPDTLRTFADWYLHCR